MGWRLVKGGVLVAGAVSALLVGTEMVAGRVNQTIPGAPTEVVVGGPDGSPVKGSIFSASEPSMVPGSIRTRTLLVTGNGAAAVTLHLSGYQARSESSSSLCRAQDPADKLDLRVEGESGVLYQGTVSAFAMMHGDGSSGLPVAAGGPPARVTLTVELDPSAGNAYMGCRTSADLVWSAA